MRDYELVVILRPDVEEEALAASLERLNQMVSARGGEVSETAQWGRRRLSYPIKSYNEGRYLVSSVRLEPERVAELESSLHLSEDFIRHLIVRKED